VLPKRVLPPDLTIARILSGSLKGLQEKLPNSFKTKRKNRELILQGLFRIQGGKRPIFVRDVSNIFIYKNLFKT
jgi:hypothetical protein